MKKRLLSAALALALALALSPLSTVVSADYYDDRFVYYPVDGGNLIIECNGRGSVVGCDEGVYKAEIPKTVICKGYENEVLYVHDHAFWGCDKLEEVIITSPWIEIGYDAFSNLPELRSVTFRDSDTHSDTHIHIDRCFRNCSKLEKVTFPAQCGSFYIGEETFSGCSKLKEITLPDGESCAILEHAFYNCDSLETVSFGNISALYDAAFIRCPKLTAAYFRGNAPGGRGGFISDVPFVQIADGFTIYYPEGASGWSTTNLWWGYSFQPYTPSASTGTPTPTPTPAASGKIAYARTQTIELDGKALTLPTYALKDSSGNETNFVRLRDIAYVLNGTAAKFNVGWDGAVNITPRNDYVPDGTELKTPFSGDRAYKDNTAATKIDGVTVSLQAIVLTDDNGGGYTYYKLRDLGEALGFNVGWSSARGIFIESNKPYTADN